MKTKTRRLIGNILVWGGLGIQGCIAYYLLNESCPYNIGTIFLGLSPFAWSLISIIALLIGGLWGMKK